MFADMLPPPTCLFDWYMVGFPSGLIVFLAVAASTVAMAVVLARKGVRGYWIIPLCVALFISADLLTYFVGIQLPRPRPRPGEFRINTDDPTKNKGTPEKSEN